MTEYVTTNIRLPKDVYREIKRRALEEEKSLAQVVRESVVQYLTAPEGGYVALGGTCDDRRLGKRPTLVDRNGCDDRRCNRWLCQS